eukprot:6300093-Karenia_brevis.AAC.1
MRHRVSSAIFPSEVHGFAPAAGATQIFVLQNWSRRVVFSCGIAEGHTEVFAVVPAVALHLIASLGALRQGQVRWLLDSKVLE